MAISHGSFSAIDTQRTSEFSVLLSADGFELAVTKERMRADRHRIVFSVITLQLPSVQASSNHRVLHLVEQLLNERLRLTDERGFLRNGDIGILLPHTHGVGAEIVLNSLMSLASERDIQFQAKIRTYPYVKDENGSDGEMTEPEDAFTAMLRSDSSHAGTKPPTQTSVRSAVQLGVDADLDGGDASELFAPIYPRWKRTADILLASVGLIIALPILIVCAILIPLTSRGPIFFRQWRTGANGKPFKIMKLRTMVVDAEELKAKLRELNERDGPAFKMKTDPRVTTVGRFLRMTGLDELPQLWNVLKGDMAIVGPRPLPCNEAAECENWHRRRLDTKPGITCTWQIMKSRVESFDDWMRLDLQYLDQRSLSYDLRLMLKTVLAVVLGRVGH